MKYRALTQILRKSEGWPQSVVLRMIQAEGDRRVVYLSHVDGIDSEQVFDGPISSTEAISCWHKMERDLLDKGFHKVGSTRSYDTDHIYY